MHSIDPRRRARAAGSRRENPDRDLIVGLRRRVAEAVGPLLAGASTCALVGFPNHNNSGDSAIWLGELALLGRLGVQPAYQCDDACYDPSDLIRAVPDGPILLHGGGNYGDLWPAQQQFREQVLRDFPRRAVVQLPQTVTFTTREHVDRHRRLLDTREADFTVLCRDAVSRSFTEDVLGQRAVLCPDTALLLELAPAAAPVVDVVVNERTDHESVREHPLELPGNTVERHDWLPPAGAHDPWRSLNVRIRTAARALAATSDGQGMLDRGRRRLPMLGASRLAERRVARACHMLTRGRAVVTDRLHGHILCLLLGIPHVVLDTGHRKVTNFHETFTSASRTTLTADTDDDVRRQLGRLLEAHTGPA